MSKAKGDRAAVQDIHRVPELADFYMFNGSDTGLGDFGPSLARQEFAEECDINVIMRRYETTGVLTHTTDREPMYLDLTEAPDLMGAMEIIKNADAAFMTLPAKVRREFDNDPVKFVEFGSLPENLDKMREWGLAPPAEKPVAPAQPEAPAPAAPAAPATGAAGAPAP